MVVLILIAGHQAHERFLFAERFGRKEIVFLRCWFAAVDVVVFVVVMKLKDKTFTLTPFRTAASL